MPQDFDQEPSRVAAGTAAELERLFARLNTRLHANQIADVALEPLVEVYQEVNASLAGCTDGFQIFANQRLRRGDFAEGRQLAIEPSFIGERKCFGVGLEEKIEGVNDGHFRDEVDFEREELRALGEDEACEEIALRVLLPIDEVGAGLHLEGVGGHPGPAVGRRS